MLEILDAKTAMRFLSNFLRTDKKKLGCHFTHMADIEDFQIAYNIRV